MVFGARERLGDVYGRIIDALDARGIRVTDADVLAQSLMADGCSIAANSLTDAVPNLYESTAENLSPKPVGSAGRLGLKQAESMKRSLQDETRYGLFEGHPAKWGQAGQPVW